MNAQDIIEKLKLQPHPEGGWYVETWREENQSRASGTAIYFLLEAHQCSHWHRVDSAEIWHWYAGGSLLLETSEGRRVQKSTLGPDLSSGETPQFIIEKGIWQKARPVKGWVLVGCTVSPGFEFSGFELAPADWAPLES